MNDKYVFEEDRKYILKTGGSIYLFALAMALPILFDELRNGDIEGFVITIIIFLVLPAAIYVAGEYGANYSIEIVGQNINFYSKKVRHLRTLPLCKLKISSLIASNFTVINESQMEKFLEKKKKVTLLFWIKGDKRVKTEIGIAMFSSGSVRIQKAIAFQHWLIEHIKENCPEEVYKEAMKHWIDYDLGEEHKEENLT